MMMVMVMMVVILMMMVMTTDNDDIDEASKGLPCIGLHDVEQSGRALDPNTSGHHLLDH